MINHLFFLRLLSSEKGRVIGWGDQAVRAGPPLLAFFKGGRFMIRLRRLEFMPNPRPGQGPGKKRAESSPPRSIRH
jgi:hypothetical protein